MSCPVWKPPLRYVATIRMATERSLTVRTRWVDYKKHDFDPYVQCTKPTAPPEHKDARDRQADKKYESAAPRSSLCGTHGSLTPSISPRPRSLWPKSLAAGPSPTTSRTTRPRGQPTSHTTRTLTSEPRFLPIMTKLIAYQAQAKNRRLGASCEVAINEIGPRGWNGEEALYISR